MFTFLRPKGETQPLGKAGQKVEWASPLLFFSLQLPVRSKNEVEGSIFFSHITIGLRWFIDLSLQQAFHEHLFCVWQSDLSWETKEELNKIQLSRCSVSVLVGHGGKARYMDTKDT